MRQRGLIGWIAVGAWALLCLRWFDVAAPWRPAWLAAIPSVLLALPVVLGAVLGLIWVARRLGAQAPYERRSLWTALGLTLALRLPLVVLGSAGYLTSDGALSGIVALRARDSREHFVFVPAVPYSGSLKSHLTAPLAALIDPAQAFALVSLLFYVAFVAATHRLGGLAGGARAAWWAGLYVALAPAFVTQYSLSNDGNYVEVLAFGAWALVLLVAFLRAADKPVGLMLATGMLLGLAFWCHILALIPMLTVGGGLIICTGPRVWRALMALAAGWVVGYLPGLIWNLGNAGESFRYLVPGVQHVGEVEPVSLTARAWGLLSDHAPQLMGYVPGEILPVFGLGVCAAAAGALAIALGLRSSGGAPAGADVARLMSAFALVNLGLALFALPYIPGNPRYLLFLMIPLPVLLARAFGHGARPALLVMLLALGTWGSVSQGFIKCELDRAWRAFAADVERLQVRRCYSDFYLATKINFLTQERVVCSAKLGPTRTEYFFEYRSLVDEAPSAAYVAVNHAQADKLERRLQRVGVGFRRYDGMKPVLYGLDRKVDPEELFPDAAFQMR
jgi:hypothetical protein